MEENKDMQAVKVAEVNKVIKTDYEDKLKHRWKGICWRELVGVEEE